NVRYIIHMDIKFIVILSVMCIITFLWHSRILNSESIYQQTFKCEDNCGNSVDDISLDESVDENNVVLEKGTNIYFPKSDHNCSRFFDDEIYANEKQKTPLILDSSADTRIDASCKAIRRRVLPGLISPTKFEVDFPVAFVRVVYKDYLLQELLFKLQYTPMNLFCFVIDEKSTALFKEQISNLTECFPNAISSQLQLPIDSAGHNMLNGFFECFRLLLTRSKWKYVITLQNHDIPLRTNFELVNILRALNGSNDVGVLHAIPQRIPKNIQWTYKALHLFKDESKNDNRSLKITKGSASCSLSRAFVDFIVNELDVRIFIELFNRMHYGVDEMLFSTLHSNEGLDAPGGYTTQCLNKFNGYITRYVVWKRSKQCKSGIDRHRVCILGIADLADLARSRFLFANKMIPFIDYSAISCWAQYLLNRSRIENRKRSINTYYYSHLPVVTFNKQRYSFTKNITNFGC
uniref:Uncharacterized protein n=1 Tax=Parascaris univalens TaxID=6257 RepID=A0A915CDE0_PARUN